MKTPAFLLMPKYGGGEFWTDGYFVSKVGKHGDEDMISRYVKGQGKQGEYKKLHEQKKKDDANQLTFLVGYTKKYPAACCGDFLFTLKILSACMAIPLPIAKSWHISKFPLLELFTSISKG